MNEDGCKCVCVDPEEYAELLRAIRRIIREELAALNEPPC